MPKNDELIQPQIVGLLKHLGIQKAHFSARLSTDCKTLVENCPESMGSLMMLCPRPSDFRSVATAAAKLESRLMLIVGDHGPEVEAVRTNMESLPHAQLITLSDYSPGNDTDIVAERGQEIGDNMLEFLRQQDLDQQIENISLDETEGNWNDLLYKIRGKGTPLVLLPLFYSPSQWDYLVDRLSQNHCTITISGAKVGAVFNLETRALGGYLNAVEKVIIETDIQPGERVLDIGCGPGSLDRWLAGYTNRDNVIVGTDPSTYFLREAEALVKNDGLEDIINFEECAGDSLPFPDDSFDVAVSFTAIQYPDADKMLSEMRRVIRSGGRVGVLARADDRPNLINVPLREEVKSRIEAQRPQRHNELGCNEASLYRRFHQSGLVNVKMFPQLAIFTPQSDGARVGDLGDSFNSILGNQELSEFRDALEVALKDGSFFVAEWFHCAVGTNP